MLWVTGKLWHNMFLISQEVLAQQLFNDGAALLNETKRYAFFLLSLLLVLTWNILSICMVLTCSSSKMCTTSFHLPSTGICTGVLLDQTIWDTKWESVFISELLHSDNFIFNALPLNSAVTTRMKSSFRLWGGLTAHAGGGWWSQRQRSFIYMLEVCITLNYTIVRSQVIHSSYLSLNAVAWVLFSQLIFHWYHNNVLSWLTLWFWTRTSKIWIWKFVKNKVYQIKDRSELMGSFFR